jgi:hypothetical protein
MIEQFTHKEMLEFAPALDCTPLLLVSNYVRFTRDETYLGRIWDRLMLLQSQGLANAHINKLRFPIRRTQKFTVAEKFVLLPVANDD